MVFVVFSSFNIADIIKTNINYRLKILFNHGAEKLLKNNSISGCCKIILPLPETKTLFCIHAERGNLEGLSPAQKKGEIWGISPQPASFLPVASTVKKINFSSFLLKKGGSGGSLPRCLDCRLGGEYALCPCPLILLYR